MDREMWDAKIKPFIPTELETVISIDRLVTLHYFNYTKDFAFGGEKHDFWEMVYVDQGEVGVAAENQGVDLQQGELIFHKPNEYHNIWAKNRFANVLIISFMCRSPAMSFFENKIITCDGEERSLLSKILSAGEVCFKESLDNVWLTQMVRCDDIPFGMEQIIKNTLEILLIQFIQRNTGSLRGSRASLSAMREGESNIVESIRQYLTENIYSEISLEDVLKRLCFSKTYLTRLFREQKGCSIMEYYSELKITEAKRLISEKELSFTQISERLGYASIHYFSHTFKKKVRMTPSEYRKSVQSRGVL